MRLRRFLVPCFVFTLAVAVGAQPASKGGINSIQPEPLKEWLGYIASDELQGRQIYTEGLGLAAAYIADHLKEWGLKPAGENGTYFQTVKVVGVRTKSGSGDCRLSDPAVNGGSASVWLSPGPLPFAVWKGMSPSS